MDIRQKIIKRLKSRGQCNNDLATLAARSNVCSQSLVNKWLAGEYDNISLERAVRLALLVGIETKFK